MAAAVKGQGQEQEQGCAGGESMYQFVGIQSDRPMCPAFYAVGIAVCEESLG